MKFLLVMLGIIVGMVLIVLCVGAFLPTQHTVTREASFEESPAVVWQAITDYNRFPEWRRTVSRVQPLLPANGKPAWIEYDRHGRGIPFEVVESSPPQRLVTRITDAKLPFGGTWAFEIMPAADGGSTLRITENGEIRNPIFRFMSRYVVGYRATLDLYLHALGAKFGESVIVED